MEYALVIAFMYVCALALAPFVAFAMYLGFDGDRLRDELPAAQPAPAAEPAPMPARAETPRQTHTARTA